MSAEHERDYPPPTAESFSSDPLSPDVDANELHLNDWEIRRLSQALLPRLRDGTVCYVRRTGEQFEVGLYPTLRQDYPSLYGFLLALNQRISGATGCTWGFIMLLLAMAGMVAVYELVPNLGVHGWWAYPLVLMTAVFLYSVGNARAEVGTYLRHSDELNRQLAQHGIGRYRLIEWLADDPNLQTLLMQLKTEIKLEGSFREP